MENDTQSDELNYDYKQPEPNYGNIFADLKDKFKEALEGTTTVESWKLFAVVGTGFIYPTLPFGISMLYGLYRVFNSMDEGRHYEVKKIKEVE